MSREFPSQVNLFSATNYNDVVASDVGSSIQTTSIIDQVYRIDIQQSGVLGVVSGRVLTDNIDNIPTEGGSIRVSQAINNYAFGIAYTLARDSNGNGRLDSSDQFIDYKVINTNVNGFVLFQKSVTPGAYFLELTDTNQSSFSRTNSGILFDPGTSYGETLGSISDPKGSSNGSQSKKSDFNKDGKTDILLNNPSQGWNTAWLMDGTNYAGFANVFGSAGYRPVATADFNKDGKTDLVVNNPSNNFNSVWFMDGGNYVSGAGLPTAAGWQIKGAADFNGDGNTDILLNNTSTNWNTVWFLGGANGASYTGFGNLPVANGWNITGVADFNGDGNSDILLNNPTQGWNSVWFLNDTTYIGFANLPSAPGWQTLGTGDFNGDSKPDIILNNLNSNWNTIWLMNGTNYAGFANLPTAPAGWQISGMA